ncbi:MAG: peptidoglycan editing factor PgeF [Desulfobacteraceae bacterium]
MVIDHTQFDNLKSSPRISHGVFSRKGGFSPPPFASLNVGLGIGDSEERVLKNRRAIARTMGFSRTLFLNQTHGKRVLVFKRESGSDGSRPNPLDLSADGAVTDIPGLLLFIQTADCQAVMLHDPVKGVAANIHSGWKGSAANIIGAGVDKMRSEFGSDPSTILAGIGPSLGPCCAELVNYATELPKNAWQYRREEQSCHFDFWRMSRDQLLDRGVKPGNIELSGTCTKCASEHYFSFRRNRTTGRFASVIALK